MTHDRYTALAVAALVALATVTGVALAGGVDTGPAQQTPATTQQTTTEPMQNQTRNRTHNRTRDVVVASLDAPPVAAPGSDVTATATLRNDRRRNRTVDVAFRIEGQGLDLTVHRNVTVAANSTRDVSFTLDTTGAPAGTYIHGVTTYNSSQFAVLELSNESTVDVDDQTTNGSSVVVSSVFLPEGGYVVVHDDSLLRGDATGSVVGASSYLDPGYHEDVRVAIDGTLGPNGTVIAMPHRETTGDTTYDFVTSDGADDGPYVVDGEAVTDTATVTVANETTTGTTPTAGTTTA